MGARHGLLALAACAPVADPRPGQSACAPANARLVALGDARYQRPIAQSAAIDTVMNAYMARPAAPPGCAIGIAQDGEVSFLKGYGVADRAVGTPYGIETMQGVGSVSKPSRRWRC